MTTTTQTPPPPSAPIPADQVDPIDWLEAVWKQMLEDDAVG